MGQANKHHQDMVSYMRSRHKMRTDAAGARLVKKDTGVTIGKNKVMAHKSPMAAKYNGDNSNLDNRLPKEQDSAKFYNKRVNKNI